MTQNKAISKVNNLLDKLIILGQANSAEYKRLCKIHKMIRQ